MSAQGKIRAVSGALLVALAAACATTQRPAPLEQAESIYNSLVGRQARQVVEGEMIKTQQAIQEADEAVARNRNRDYVAGLSRIALRQAQTAEAEFQRTRAAQEADSLRTARLNVLLSMSEAQRNQLAQQQRLSEQEIAALRERNIIVSAEVQRERERANVAGAEAERERQRADSLRRVAEEATARLNDALTQLRTLVVEITNIRETARGLVIDLSDVLFDVNRATLKAGAESNIRKIAAILQQFPDYQISVEGHTDATGSDAYNQELSERRAAAVRTALVAGGVEPGRITSRGFGESQPRATNDTPAGRQLNRRVEVIVLGAGKVADVVLPPGASDTTRRDTTGTLPPR